MLEWMKCRVKGGHFFVRSHSALVDMGRTKMVVYKCQCGREKVKFL